MMSSARNSSTVAPTFLDIYRKLTTAKEGIGQLSIHAENMRRSAEMDFLDTPEGSALRSEMISVVEYTAAMFKKCISEMSEIELLKEKYVPCFEENQTLCLSLCQKIKSGNYTEVQKAFTEYKPSSIPQLRSNKTETSEYYRALRGEKLNPGVKELAKKYLSATPDEIKSIYIRSCKYSLIISIYSFNYISTRNITCFFFSKLNHIIYASH
jgi:hypothetical protein